MVKKSVKDNRVESNELIGKSGEYFFRWRIAQEIIQQPVILTTTVICIVSIMFTIFLAAIFELKWASIIFTLISGITSAGLYFYRYQKEYPIRAREIMELIKRQMKQSKEEELKQRCKYLEAGFSGIDSARGLKVLAQLVREFEDLQIALNQQRITDPLTISCMPNLAEEVFLRGMRVLSDALDLMKIIQSPGNSPGTDKLKTKIIELEKDIQTMKDNQDMSELTNIKIESLAFHRERLNMIDRIELQIEQLIHHAERCEIALQSARIGLAGIRSGGSKTSVDLVIETLQKRINQIKEVQDELQKMGY